MDYSGFRRSQNVEPQSPFDYWRALLANPYRNQWYDPTNPQPDLRGLITAQRAQDFPQMPPGEQAGSPLSQVLGYGQLMQMLGLK